MVIAIEKVGGGNCEVSGGFVDSEVYVGFLEDFTSLMEPKEICNTAPALKAGSLSELVTITTSHSFKTAAVSFIKIKAIAESVGLETNQIGKNSPVQENKLTVQMLGSKPDILGFKRLCKGRDLVVLANEFESGQIRQIGSAKYAGRLLESSSKIEPSLDADNTTTLVFADKQLYDAPIYKGNIAVRPGA